MDQNLVSTGLSLATLRICIADLMDLQVRTESRNQPPGFLYQEMPEETMSLFATLPQSVSAVSIPHGENGEYPIHKALPRTENRFIVIYTRKPNGRYEAVEVLSQGRSYGIAQFHEFAARWVEKSLGGVKLLEGRHAYFAPTSKLWSVILRDGGYTPVDPASLPNELTPGLLEKMVDPEHCGLAVRIQLHSARSSAERIIPVFARTEVSVEPHLSSPSWISFVEYRKLRALQSRPPSGFLPDFREWVDALRFDSGMESWVFRKGMFFGEHVEWWGSRNRRRTEHEGIDFAEGIGSDGNMRQIPEGTNIRSICEGEVVAILDDFLGKTIVVRHPAMKDESGNVFYTMFSHIAPCCTVADLVARGAVIGKMGRAVKPTAPQHLHLTCAWISRFIEPRELTLNHINPGYSPVILINLNSLVHPAREPQTRQLCK